MVTVMHRTTDDLTATHDTDPYDQAVSYPVPIAAKLVGISERRMWDVVKAKKVKSFMTEGRRLISRKALEEYIALREAAGTDVNEQVA